MKTILSALCCCAFFLSYSQSYVDSGIRHYDAKEYKEALVDFNEAENAKSLFTSKAVSKLYFYKAMSLYHLADVEKEAIGTILAIHQYFEKSLSLDSAWFPQIDEVETNMTTSLIERAAGVLKLASRAREKEERISSLESFIDILKLAEEVKLIPEVELKLANGYELLGDVYFEDSSNVASLRRAGEYYGYAIKYYEVARYNDPFSKSIIETLLVLSKRMDDPERVKEYSDLMALAGG